jgi:hypothetical protein
MKQGFSSEASSQGDSQEVPKLLMNPKVHYRDHKTRH